MRSLVILVAVLVFSVAAQANLIDQNFDDVGVFPDGTILGSAIIGDDTTSVGGWEQVGNMGENGATISSLDSRSPNQSAISARDPGYESGRLLGSRSNLNISGGNIKFEVSVKRATAGVKTTDGTHGTGAAANITLTNAAQARAVGYWGTNWGNIGLVFYRDNDLYCFDYGAQDGPSGIASQPWRRIVTDLDTPGQEAWNDFVMDIDVDNLTYDVSMNGNLLYSGANFRMDVGNESITNGIDGVTTISHYALVVDAANDVFFDDILITPEPATMILLGLGGLLGLRRRR